MAAHYRLAMPDAKLGLPEVQLGLLPGSGGTQRAPRLMGVEAAVELMLSGRHMKAQEALDCKLIDRLGEGADVLQAGLTFAHELLASAAPVRRTRDMDAFKADPDHQMEVLAKIQKDVEKKSRGLFSPLKVIEAVRQLRHEAHPAVQVPGCDLALAHGTGGSMATRHGSATLILERE